LEKFVKFGEFGEFGEKWLCLEHEQAYCLFCLDQVSLNDKQQPALAPLSQQLVSRATIRKKVGLALFVGSGARGNYSRHNDRVFSQHKKIQKHY
jgi:hypothetical protein